MKHSNAIRLAKLARANVFSGAASALTLAKRIKAITKSSEAEEIVSRVYTHGLGTAVYECRECGQEHLTTEEAGRCCAENEDWNEDWENQTAIPCGKTPEHQTPNPNQPLN